MNKNNILGSEKIMDILKKILNNPELTEKIRLKCDIELYPELQDLYDENGHITWNIEGKALEQTEVEENLFYFLMEL